MCEIAVSLAPANENGDRCKSRLHVFRLASHCVAEKHQTRFKAAEDGLELRIFADSL